jgi:hypothetical protein
MILEAAAKLHQKPGKDPCKLDVSDYATMSSGIFHKPFQEMGIKSFNGCKQVIRHAKI